MEQLANKVHLPVDADMLRLKIQKDLEARHRGDLDLKSQEIERLQDQYYDAKRQLEVAKTQLETSRHEHEKEFSEMKDRMKSETSELLIENQALQTKMDDRRDRELIKQLRRDLDEARRKAQDLTAEASELRRDRDSLRLEKNEQYLEQQKNIEDLKALAREAASEKDRAVFKSNGMQEEHQRMQLALERKTGETNQAVAEKVQLETMLKSKDNMMDTL